MQDQDDVIREFLIESNENLAKLDREMVQLEQNPNDADLIASIFRTIHTIKGTCGFFGFGILESTTHIAESILSQVRDKERELTPELVSLILETVDAVKAILGSIETSNQEGEDLYQDLRKRLNHAHKSSTAKTSSSEAVAPAAAAPSAQTPVVVQPVHEAPKATPAEAPFAESAVADQKPDAVVAAPEDSTPDAPLQKNMGEILAERAGVRPEDISAAIQEQKQGDPRHLGEILVDHGLVQPAAVRDALEEQQKETRTSKVADSTIRVDVGLLDKLMNLVGELVLARNQILQATSATQGSTLGATAQRLNLITSELQEGVMKTRMQPIGVVWDKLPRVVRDLSASCGKKIQIEMDGAETELDKTIIEAIKDPLTHIVRNSCDHGIELPADRIRAGKNPQGKLLLRAYHEGGHVIIEISDDGAGINPERIKDKAIQKGLIRSDQVSRMTEREIVNLVFAPGFSTAETVSNISGRGVGMDVVRTNIERIGGTVDLSGRTGEGTTLRIKIPLTLAIIPGLVITVRNQSAKTDVNSEERFVIPQASLLELICLEGEEANKQMEKIHGTLVYRRRGKLLPLVYLNRVLNMTTLEEVSEATNIVVLQAEDRSFGLVVDGISDTQEIVVKPLGKQLKGLSCYAGATIMGDGKVALILDVMGLAQLAGIVSESRETSRTGAKSVERSDAGRQTLLLFSTGRHERLSVPLSLVNRLEEFARSKVESAAGRPVLHYRDEILSLVSLGTLLDPQAPDKAMEQDPLQVIVFSEGKRRIGLVVEKILDIVEEAVTVKHATASPGLLGSAVVAGKITDFVDLFSAVQACGDTGHGSNIDHNKGYHLLLVESSPLIRGTLRNYLEICGHTVTEAASCKEALEKLAKHPADLVVAATDQSSGGQDLLEAIRNQPDLTHIPVLALTQDAGLDPDSTSSQAFDAQHLTTDRDGLLKSIAQLAGGPKTRHAAAGAR
jgi:two-component system chemotaxis sensor kinase CheA